MTYFLRLEASDGAAAIFDAWECQEGPPAEPVYCVRSNRGEKVRAQPIRLAMCKLWVGTVCDVRPESGDGEYTRPVPDLLEVVHLGKDKADRLVGGRPPLPGSPKEFFGLYLVHVCEIDTQVVPTIQLNQPYRPNMSNRRRKKPRKTRYFMTCSKMSGK